MTLLTELQTDPLARGYSTMTTDQTVASLLAVNRPVTKPSITASELFECTDQGEWNALTATQKSVYSILTGLNSPLSTAVGSKTRAAITSIFPAGGPTLTALGMFISQTVSRADELGLTVDWGLVHAARASLGWGVI